MPFVVFALVAILLVAAAVAVLFLAFYVIRRWRAARREPPAKLTRRPEHRDDHRDAG